MQRCGAPRNRGAPLREREHTELPEMRGRRSDAGGALAHPFSRQIVKLSADA